LDVSFGLANLVTVKEDTTSSENNSGVGFEIDFILRCEDLTVDVNVGD
jgi:hypothetical protein